MQAEGQHRGASCGAMRASICRIRCSSVVWSCWTRQGLNAIGTEPELTLGLLPQAHATVFILGADTGVTKSDLSHLA
jgi:hypothetical protein